MNQFIHILKIETDAGTLITHTLLSLLVRWFENVDTWKLYFLYGKHSNTLFCLCMMHLLNATLNNISEKCNIAPKSTFIKCLSYEMRCRFVLTFTMMSRGNFTAFLSRRAQNSSMWVCVCVCVKRLHCGDVAINPHQDANQPGSWIFMT